MPRPTCDVTSPAYQEILRARAAYRDQGQDYKDVLWMEDTLKRLEKKLYHDDQDQSDFLKVKDIYARVFEKSGKRRGESAENHTTPQYIWRTAGDGDVRPSHAVNNGKIFSWDNPPPTGHPGEAPGCRCWAEPYKDPQAPELISIETRVIQIVTDAAPDAPRKWTLFDYGFHYFYENGRGVTLHEIGILGDIISLAKTVVYPKIERLIFQKVQKEREGNYPFRWEDSYSFYLTEYSVGGATVTVNATLNVKNMGYYYQIKGKLDYDFYDKFTDPQDLLNN